MAQIDRETEPEEALRTASEAFQRFLARPFGFDDASSGRRERESF